MKEIAEAITVAMFVAGGSQLGWANICGENVYDIVFGEKKPEEPEKEKKEEKNLKKRKGAAAGTEESAKE
jgi:hypothetical protein